MNSILKKRPVKIILVFLLVIAAIVVLLPFAVQFGAEYALKKQGAQQANIEDINLNLFAGTFELKHLTATFNDQPPLSLEHLFIDLKISGIFKSRVILNNIRVKGLNAIVKRDNNGAIEVNGYIIPTADNTGSKNKAEQKTDAKPLEFALHSLNLSSSQLIYQEHGFKQNLRINNISINNIKSWDAYSIAKIALHIEEGKTNIHAKADLVLFNNFKHAKGTLNIHGLNTQTYKKFHQQHINKLHTQVDADINFDVYLVENIKGSIEHNITLSRLNAQHLKLAYALDSLVTQGKTQVNGSKVVVNAELKMNNSLLTDLETATPLNSFKTLALNKLHFDGKKITFNTLVLADIDVLENKAQQKLLNLARLTLNNFEFNLQTSALNLALVELQKPDINATLSKQKQLTHLALIEPILERFQPAEPTPSDNKETAKPMLINIKQVRLTEPGMLHFNDLSVEPAYSTKLHFNTIEIDRISNQSPAYFKLAFKQGDYTTIDINGQGLMLNPTKNLSYTVDIKQLDLPPISAYTNQTMGYSLKSGVVDTVIKGSIKQQQIDTNVVLRIDSIEVIETNKETAKKLSSASGMSIDLALSTLKDKNNIIDLEIPIGGDIQKPDFDLSLIINKAMGIAMKFASMSYLQAALQPFSTLVTLFNLASDAASSISLAPISFAVNQTTLSSQQKELLAKVSNILTERPGIKVKACGIASLNDQTSINTQLLSNKKKAYLKKNKDKKLTKKQTDAALKKLTVSDKERHFAMKKLADKRAAAVKSYLTKIKNIDSAKILNCLSAENLDSESKPVVELVI